MGVEQKLNLFSIFVLNRKKRLSVLKGELSHANDRRENCLVVEDVMAVDILQIPQCLNLQL